MRIIISVLFLFLLLFLGKAYYDTHTIEIKHYEIKESPLGRVMAGLKVAFLSDLHLRRIDGMGEKILKLLDEERPDLIFLSGDYICFKGSYEPVVSFFNKLRAPYGVYAVLGNTEYTNENGSCVLCHIEHSKNLRQNPKPLLLRNSFRAIEVGDQRINIIGVDDPVKGKSNLNTAMKGVDFKYPTVLLTHSPEVFEEAASHGIDLVLAGHNHGGQLFLTEYLRKILPLDPVLEFLEGFFREGRTLMYVSRGIGTSYLPFRFGIKPEITFFEFTNSTNKETSGTNEETNGTSRNIQIARVNSTATPQHGRTAPQQHSFAQSLVSPTISNHPPQTVFAGLSLTNLVETFNVFSLLGFTAARQYGSTSAHNILFDFESEEELNHLNWECGKWFELSEENVTSGKYSLKVFLPLGQYPGINFQEFKEDWSKARFLRMEVFNSSEEPITFHIRIDDYKSGWEYANRFDMNIDLKEGMNYISIPTDSIRTNLYHRPLNLKKIKRMMVFIPNNNQKRELYLDNIRLE